MAHGARPLPLIVLVLALSTLLALAPSSAARADGGGGSTLEAYGAFGFGGDGSYRVDDPFVGTVRTTFDLEPSAGFGLRYVAGLSPYFGIGALFEALTMEPDERDAKRRWVIDFSLRPEVRYAFRVGEFTLEPYLAVPIGFTAAMLDDYDDARSPHGDEAWPGLNLGVMAGARFITEVGLGGFLELGWRHHQAWSHYARFNKDYETNATANQFALHVGGLYRF